MTAVSSRAAGFQRCPREFMMDDTDRTLSRKKHADGLGPLTYYNCIQPFTAPTNFHIFITPVPTLQTHELDTSHNRAIEPTLHVRHPKVSPMPR